MKDQRQWLSIFVSKNSETGAMSINLADQGVNTCKK